MNLQARVDGIHKAAVARREADAEFQRSVEPLTIGSSHTIDFLVEGLDNLTVTPILRLHTTTSIEQVAHGVEGIERFLQQLSDVVGGSTSSKKPAPPPSVMFPDMRTVLKYASEWYRGPNRDFGWNKCSSACEYLATNEPDGEEPREGRCLVGTLIPDSKIKEFQSRYHGQSVGRSSFKWLVDNSIIPNPNVYETDITEKSLRSAQVIHDTMARRANGSGLVDTDALSEILSATSFIVQ